MTFKTMKQFIVPCQDKPGMLGQITVSLAKAGVNINGIATHTVAGMAYVSFTGEPVAKIEEVLKANKWNYFTNDVFALQLQNKPGELAKVTELLGEKGINIQNIHGYTEAAGQATLVLNLTDYEKGKKFLETVAA